MNGIDKIAKLSEAQQKLEIKKSLLLEESLKSNDPNQILKAQQYLMNIEKKQDSERKSYFVDPHQFTSSFGYKERRIALSYNMLYGMSQTPMINAIMRTRINQVASFAEEQKDEFSIGFKIRKRKVAGAINDEKLSNQERKDIDILTDFILNCGEKDVWGSDDFDGFIRKVTGDSLRYDQMTFEVERNRRGVPVAFHAADASTFRVADTIDTNQEDVKNGIKRAVGDLRGKYAEVNGYLPSHVQIYQSQVVDYFYPWELCFGVRNPSNSIFNYGYGVSELEELVSIVTGLLWGEQYNSNFFKQGSAPKGFLRVNGEFPSSRLHEFRQMWNATIRGVHNSHKTPVIEADKVEWVDLQKTNRDMEFTQWMEFLIKIACAVFTIDPAEINFPLKGGANESALFEGNNEARLRQSKDKGLYPLLKFIQKRVDKWVIQQINPKYEFVFVGLDSMSPQQQLEHDDKVVRTYKTVNEIREEKGLKPLESGNIILDSNFAQSAMMAQQEAMMGGQEEDFPGTDQAMQEAMQENESYDVENPIEKALNDYLSNLMK